MKIAIKLKNAEKIEAALKAVNGKAVEHTITTYAEVEAYALQGFARIHDLLKSKKEMAGSSFEVVSGNKLPNRYKGKKIVTFLVIEYNAKGDAFLVNVKRLEQWPNQAGRRNVVLTVAQHEEAILEFRKQYLIRG